MKQLINNIIAKFKNKRIRLYGLIMLAAMVMGLIGYVAVDNNVDDRNLYLASFTDVGITSDEGVSCYAGVDPAANVAGTTGAVAGAAVGGGTGAIVGEIIGGVIGLAAGAFICWAACATGAGCLVTSACAVVGAIIGVVVGFIVGAIIGGTTGYSIGGALASSTAKNIVGSVPMRVERINSTNNVTYHGEWSTECDPFYHCPVTVPNTIDLNPVEVYYGQTEPVTLRVVRLTGTTPDIDGANNLLEDAECLNPGPSVVITETGANGPGEFGDYDRVGDAEDNFVDGYTFTYLPPESGEVPMNITIQQKFGDKFGEGEAGSWGTTDEIHLLAIDFELKNDPCFVPEGEDLVIEHKQDGYYYPDGVHDKFTVKLTNDQIMQSRCLTLTDQDDQPITIYSGPGYQSAAEYEFTFDAGDPDENGSNARSIKAVYETVLPNVKQFVETTLKFGVGTLPPQAPVSVEFSGDNQMILGETKDYSITLKDENGWKTHKYDEELVMSDGTENPGFIDGPFLPVPGNPHSECDPGAGVAIYNNNVIYECSADAEWVEADQIFSYTPSAAGGRTLTAVHGEITDDLTVNVIPASIHLDASALQTAAGQAVAFTFFVAGNQPFGTELLNITIPDADEGGSITELVHSEDGAMVTFDYTPATTGVKTITATYGDQTVQSTIEAIAECGNGIPEAAYGEECDDGNIVTEACDYGETSCFVCNENCLLVSGAASYCGDGTKQEEAGEECDDGNTVTETCGYGITECDVCNSECQEVPGETSRCGDGIIQENAGEECDDGNFEEGDGCSASCIATSQAFINNCPNITVRPYLRLQAAGNADAFQWKLNGAEHPALETDPETGNPPTKPGSIVLFENLTVGAHTARVEGTTNPSLDNDECNLDIINYTQDDLQEVTNIVFQTNIGPVDFTTEQLWLYDTNGNNEIDNQDKNLIFQLAE